MFRRCTFFTTNLVVRSAALAMCVSSSPLTTLSTSNNNAAALTTMMTTTAFRHQSSKIAQAKNTATDIKKLVDTSEYHNITERFIEDASIFGDKLLDKFPVIEDVNMRDGVLEIKATGTGTFVLNKQAPLHQLWYSSPISGPHHYDYDTVTGRWVSDKDRHDLQEKIHRELSKVCGEEVSF